MSDDYVNAVMNMVMVFDEHGPAAPQGAAGRPVIGYEPVGGVMAGGNGGGSAGHARGVAPQMPVQTPKSLGASFEALQRQSQTAVGGMGRDELRNYLDLIVKTLNTNVRRLQEAERIMAGIADRLDEIEAKMAGDENGPGSVYGPVGGPLHRTAQGQGKPSTHDDDPTVRAMSALRAKGLA